MRDRQYIYSILANTCFSGFYRVQVGLNLFSFLNRIIGKKRRLQNEVYNRERAKKELEERGISVSETLLYRYIRQLPDDIVKVQRKLKRKYWKVSTKAIDVILNGEI